MDPEAGDLVPVRIQPPRGRLAGADGGIGRDRDFPGSTRYDGWLQSQDTFLATTPREPSRRSMARCQRSPPEYRAGSNGIDMTYIGGMPP
ncbi:hypothetical protein Lfu02_68120 [Longispora fulva]|nr:hypothetical protein Lfu02_68120 [Longispora fulva]